MKVRRALLALALVVAGLIGLAPAASAAGSEVSYDRYSVMIDGKRVLLQGAEFHYFRLPSPDLWRDILEKEKAAGFNTISLYFHWGYHSPSPGVYDFTGVRDVDRLLRLAKEVGLYVVARPGPYINAETTGGGFPAWLKLVPGRARSSATGYTAAYRDWLAHIDPIIARHQITRGGSVLLYNVENEYAVNTDAAYMQDLQDTARSHGIDVPITTNNCCDAASWTSTWGSGLGAVQIPGVDDYPQSFDCGNAGTVWGPWGAGVTERVREDAPVFAAEYQAGAIDLNNAGYEACRELTGVAYMKYFQKNNLIVSGATALNYYMGFGGTNWGWLGQPNDVYTSYDYGAAITEGRQLTAKYDEFKRQSYFLRALTPLTKTDAVAAPVAPGLETAARANPDTGTRFVLLRNTSTTAVDSVVESLPVRLAGRDAKVLVAGYDLGGHRLRLSTSEIMTHLPIGGRDLAVMYGSGSTLLEFAQEPRVSVLQGAVRTSFGGGVLRLDYDDAAPARVLVSGGGRRPLLLLLGSAADVASYWQDGSVLVRGTSLLRSASVSSTNAALRADTAVAGPVEVFADGARSVTVNGRPVAVRPTASGSLAGTLPGARPVSLPALSKWKQEAEAPEARPGFDDSRWTVAGKTTSLSSFEPLSRPVLFSDEYGFHTGGVWYRGRFTATGTETAVNLNAITGRRGNYLVWLNGRYLGSAAGGVQADSEPPANPSPGAATFPLSGLTPGSTAVLSVLVQNMGNNDDWTADDNRMRQPRGLVGARIAGSDAAVTWRIQGTARIDPARGPLNNGGLFGERAGWSLPGFSDRSWATAGSSVPAGVTWFRTGFRLALPAGQDTSVALRFDGAPPAGYRALVYLNGWNVGQYGAEIGPQTDFVLPAGLLRTDGANTLAVAVVATAPSAVRAPRLVVAGAHRGGVPVSPVPAPARVDHGGQ